MKYLILILIGVICSGCLNREKVSVYNEPDTEWILAQYQNNDPDVVDARRINEGW